MFGIWLCAVCLRCGNQENKKYYVDTLENFNNLMGIKCNCGNDDESLFRLIEIKHTKAKKLS